jgi:hypothetical protein
MPSTLPAQLRVWSALASQGHVVPAAGGVMFNAAQEIERMEMLLEAGGGRYWEGRYRDEAARVDELEMALRNCCDKWENGNGVCEWMEAVDEARAALGEKKDG